MYCYEKPDLEDLVHYGVPGMKWGKRKARSIIDNQKAFKSKATAIAKNRYANGSDKQRMKFASQSMSQKVKTMGTSVTLQFVLRDIMSGKFNPSDPKYLATTAKSVAKYTSINLAKKEVLARSVAKRYNDDGKRSNPKDKIGLFTKEDKIEMGMDAAIKFGPIAKSLMAAKAYNTASKRQANEDRFNKWGSNILSEKVDNVIWQSPDLSTSVIDNRNK